MLLNQATGMNEPMAIFGQRYHRPPLHHGTAAGAGGVFVSSPEAGTEADTSVGVAYQNEAPQ